MKRIRKGKKTLGAFPHHSLSINHSWATLPWLPHRRRRCIGGLFWLIKDALSLTDWLGSQPQPRKALSDIFTQDSFTTHHAKTKRLMKKIASMPYKRKKNPTRESQYLLAFHLTIGQMALLSMKKLRPRGSLALSISERVQGGKYKMDCFAFF